MEDCLRKAGFGDRLKELPLGTDTFLSKNFSEEGVDMSGGEKTKDRPCQNPLQGRSFHHLGRAHRLSSCRFCDNICVFDKGTVVQQGSHDSLVQEAGGKYHELWFVQAQYYTDDQGSSDKKVSRAEFAL